MFCVACMLPTRHVDFGVICDVKIKASNQCCIISDKDGEFVPCNNQADLLKAVEQVSGGLLQLYVQGIQLLHDYVHS